MKKMMIKIITVAMALVVLCTSLPLSVLAETGAGQGNGQNPNADVSLPSFIELNDGCISIKISKENGGYYMSTVEGDVITKKDDDSDLIYADGLYDTSFTSFRVKKNGQVRDYIFGRDYSHLGIATSAVNVYKSADNAVVAEWTVDGILFSQTIALMGADTYQHGMAYISYTAKNTTGEKIDSIKARVMVDTALGTSDYAYYMLAQPDGSYRQIEEETTVKGSDYYNYFFSYDSKTAPTVTAYTLNGNVNGESIVPEKVTFAHWYNLASTVYDYTPSTDAPLKFTELYGSIDHLTQDSAYALYYDLSAGLAAGETSAISMYYGVYSNYSATDAKIALNFTTSGTMFFNEAKNAYKDQNGKLPGNFSATFKIQNVADEDIPKLTVAIYPEEEIVPYNGNSALSGVSAFNPYCKVIEDLRVGETNDVRFDFGIAPTFATGYRKIKIVVYNTTAQSELNDQNVVLEDEYYILCPGAQSADLGFTGMTPESVFVRGKRFAYITGNNFGLIRDKSQYRILLRPLEGGDEVVLDMDKVVINTEKNTATLVLDMELEAGAYEAVIDWNDATLTDMTNESLRIMVSEVPQKGDPGFVSSGVYGIAAIIRDGRHYELVNYESEADYMAKKPDDKDVMLVMRGDFNFLSTEEKGNYKAEAITLMSGDTIMINDTLEVRNGRVTVNKIYDGDKQARIDVDIEGKVYTTRANTKVWDGVLAITSFKEGTLYTLPVYSKDGKMSIREGEEGGERITLLWPGAASGAQTLVGLLINMRYGEFALMKQGDSLARVIAFGASLDPSILVPGGRHATDHYYSNLEKKQLEMGIGAYTAAQLRATDTQYKKDQAAWRAEQAGSLNLYIDDILFGAGGFIGFNTQIEVGIPSYVEGMPSVEGTLYLKVINDYWEFGVEGAADMMIFEMEASLHFKSYKGIPVPDSFYFFIGGTNPGIPVDPFGVFWVRGAGAGIGEIYETFFGSRQIPPLTLTISGEFALFSVLSARADISLSAQGFSGYLSKVGVAGITIIDRIGGSVYWYPNFSLSFGVQIDIFDAIVGNGSIVVRENGDDFYFGAYASATVRIPRKIWLIGGKKIGEAAIGIDTKKVWGSVKVIGIGVGLVYYWGGDLDVSVGKKLSVPSPIEVLNHPVAIDPISGDVLYMQITSEIARIGSSVLGENQWITSSADRMNHSVTLSARQNEDILLAFTYPAENEYLAHDIKNTMQISLGEEGYPLAWYNDSYDADSEANRDTNAMFQYDPETKLATVSVSFTDPSQYGQTASVKMNAASEVEMFTIVKSVAFDDITVDSSLTEVTLTGAGLEKLSRLNVYAEDAAGALYPLCTDYDTSAITSDTVTVPVTIPANLPSGAYTLKAVGAVLDSAGNETECPMISTTFEYVNPVQPQKPLSARIELAGNYTFSLDAKTDAPYDGLLTNIYEVTEDGYLATVFTDVISAQKEGESKTELSLALGGRTAIPHEDGTTDYIGLEAGKTYVVSVQSFRTMEDGSRLLSEPLLSNEVMMVTPVKTVPEFSIEGAVALAVGGTDVTVDTVSKNSFTVKVAGVESILSATYRLGDGDPVAWDGKDITFRDLADGTYTLSVEGINSTRDHFNALYQFTVDTEGPSMLISSPQGGGFFEGGKLTVTGISEVGARIEITVGDGLPTEVYADAAGAFSAEVEVDSSYAYQEIKVYAYDAAGNSSMPFGCTVTNGLLGDPNLEVVVLYEGREVSEIVCSEEEKQLTMAFKSGDQYITVNPDSPTYSRILWKAQTIEKSASISTDGRLTGDNGAGGVVVVSLDNRSAMVEMVSIDLSDVRITPVLPEGGYVYDGTKKEPQLVFDTEEELVAGKDYTVSYVNNLDAGIASVIVSAVEGGKCIGTGIINFEIAACDISAAKLTLTRDDKGAVKVTVTLGEKTLTPDVDYTLSHTVDAGGIHGVVTVTGKGNYKGLISQRYQKDLLPMENPNGSTESGVSPLVWIIPVSTAGVLLLLFAALMTVKTVRRKKRKHNIPVGAVTEEAPMTEETAQEPSIPIGDTAESNEPDQE